MATPTAAVYITVEGAKELERKLNELSKVQRRSVIRTASRESMKPLHAATKSAAPVKTGLLKKSIKLRAFKKSRRSVGVNVVIQALDLKKAADRMALKRTGRKPGSRAKKTKSYTAFYASFIELGTKHIKGRHFMKQVAKQMGPSVVRNFLQKVDNLIKSIASKQ